MKVEAAMGSEPSSTVSVATTSSATPPVTATPASTSPCGKRSRDPEDEVYIDNLHSHKRYLSEIMASSLNGLTVGDPLPENLMESPTRSDCMFYLRDDMPLQYSPMSEDSDDSRYCEASLNTWSSSQPESRPTSPVSPYRCQRPLSAFSSTLPTTSYPSHGGCNLGTRQRGSDSEGRFPSSPSDICHSADLRRAALLRSVQMRTQPSGPPTFDSSFGPGQEPVPNAEDRPCQYMKPLVDERDYTIEECSMSICENGFHQEKLCSVLDMNLKEDRSED